MNIAILGLGTVGSGVYQQLIDLHNNKYNRSKVDINIKYGLVKEITKEISNEFKAIKLSDNIEDIFADSSIDCIVELMGGVEFPYQVIKRALENNIHVVSANKDLIAVHGKELLEFAKKNNCSFYFEAAVAGGIPIIRTINKSLVNDEIYDIKGILNGTSNYILTKMSQEGLSYDKALKQAQELGFAEADPTADVGGYDAARKVAILAMLSFLTNTTINDVAIKGIQEVNSEDIKVAQKLGYTIKLIGHTYKLDNSISLSVAPCFINNDNPLAQVNNELNSVSIKGKYINTLNLVGPGAGSLPTGIAVVSDIIEVAYQQQAQLNGKDIIIPSHNLVVNNNKEEKYIIFGDINIIDKLTNDYKTMDNIGYCFLKLKQTDLNEFNNKENITIYKVL